MLKCAHRLSLLNKDLETVKHNLRLDRRNELINLMKLVERLPEGSEKRLRRRALVSEIKKREEPSDRFMMYISIYLHFTRNITRILFPSRKPYIERGRKLRDLINLPTDHEFFEGKEARDMLVHFDERVDAETEGKSYDSFILSSLGPGHSTPKDDKEIIIFQCDFKNNILFLLDRKFDILKIHNDAMIIRTLVHDASPMTGFGKSPLNYQDN